MNTTSITRPLCAALSAILTAVVFSSVVAIAEPQRTVLLAKSQAHGAMASRATAMQVAAAAAPLIHR